MNQFQKLAEPFQDDEHEWLPAKIFRDEGTAYIAAYIRDQPALDRLDEVFGPENWQLRFQSIPQAHQHAFIAAISIRNPLNESEWLTKEGVGVNENSKEVEMSLKGGATDSFKRAAMTWGMGRYLRKLPKQIKTQYDPDKKTILAVPLISKLLKGEYVWVNPYTLEPVDAPKMNRKQSAKLFTPTNQNEQRATVYEDFTIPFGASKGRHLSEVTSLQELKKLGNIFIANIEDPSKSSFHERNRKQLEAVKGRLIELGYEPSDME